MSKNGLAEDAAAPDLHPSKRLKLAPRSEDFSSTTSIQSISDETTLNDRSAEMSQPRLKDVLSPGAEEQARELKAGIEQYVNTEVKGFRGVLKQRYTDFMVNEISLDGTVLHLLNDRAPKFTALNTGKENKSEAVFEEVATQPEPKVEVTPTPLSESDPTPQVVESKQVTITETSSTKEGEPEPAKNVESSAGESSLTERNVPFTLSPEDDAILEDYFGTDFKTKILDLHAKILAKPYAKPASFGTILSEPFTDRVKRGRLHGDVRRIFESRLETTLVDGGNIKFSAASKSVAANHGKKEFVPLKQNQGGRGQRVNQAKGKLGWEELGGQYLHFTMFKENKDTMEVLSYLARTLRVKPKDFAFSGTKDRRAITVQRVSVFRQHAHELARLNPSIRQARIGDFKYEKHQLKLGELNGNFFTISLRDCHFDGEDGLNDDERMQLAELVLNHAIKHFKQNGFINYFGLQRFGTFTVSNDLVGAQILNGNFEAAVKSILHYNPKLLDGDPNTTDRVGRDDIARARAIHEFETTGQSKSVLDQLPRRFTAEQSIIRHLGNKNSRKDYIGALGMIQRNLKTMYVHAYQSLVWNVAASERWSRYGNKVVEGDLVIVETGDNRGTGGAKEELDENGEVIVLPAEDDSALQADDKFERARPLSADEAASGKYTVFDVVLPTPGFDVEYPQNDIGDFYKEFMSSERGGGLDPANMRRSQKDFSLSGNYRKLLSRAEDLSFQVKKYYSETEQLTETDLEILEKSRPQNKQNGQQRNSGNDWYSQRNGRGAYHANRGRLAESRNANPQFTGDIRFEDPNFVNSKASSSTSSPVTAAADVATNTAETKEEKATRQAAAIKAWNALPAQLVAEQKAASEGWQPTRIDVAPEKGATSVVAPPIQDTFKQTVVDATGRREVVGVSTATIQGDGDQTAKAVEELPHKSPSGQEQSSVIEEAVSLEALNVEEKADKPEQNVTIPRGANEPLASNDAELGGVPVPTEPARLAVIIKFALGTSQYATMALRELLKAGGVIPYKPDFSTGR